MMGLPVKPEEKSDDLMIYADGQQCYHQETRRKQRCGRIFYCNSERYGHANEKQI